MKKEIENKLMNQHFTFKEGAKRLSFIDKSAKHLALQIMKKQIKNNSKLYIVSANEKNLDEKGDRK